MAPSGSDSQDGPLLLFLTQSLSVVVQREEIHINYEKRHCHLRYKIDRRLKFSKPVGCVCACVGGVGVRVRGHRERREWNKCHINPESLLGKRKELTNITKS